MNICVVYICTYCAHLCTRVYTANLHMCMMYMCTYHITINVNVYNVCNMYIYIDIMYYMCIVIIYAVVII